LVDVFKLTMNPEAPFQYRLDGAWVELEKTEAKLELDTGLFVLPLSKTIFRSKHGPVIDTKQGFFAIRWARIRQPTNAAEQWFRMNKATSCEEWTQAMSMTAIPMFNTVFADRHHIFYVYNAAIPIRKEGPDYTKLLPGDDSSLIFQDYLPFARLPQVHN